MPRPRVFSDARAVPQPFAALLGKRVQLRGHQGRYRYGGGHWHVLLPVPSGKLPEVPVTKCKKQPTREIPPTDTTGQPKVVPGSMLKA